MLTLVLAMALLPPACMALAAPTVPHQAYRYRADLTRQAREIWGLSAPVATFAAQIHQESRWNPEAVSRVGAQGMAQFMPGTSSWISNLFPSLSAGQPTSPTWSMRALVLYDRWLWNRLPGSDCERMASTLRGYNGGLGYIQREQATGRPCAAFRAATSCRENLAYPRRILTVLEPVYVTANWGGGVCRST